MSAAYIFDVEGTLIDCVPDILRCWSETLTAHGIAVPSAHLQRLSGMDGDEMLTTLVPGLDATARKKILAGQGERYRAIYLPRVRAFPGVRAAFAAIKSSGGRIALATDCKNDELKHYRSLMNVDDLVDAIACGDEVSTLAPFLRGRGMRPPVNASLILFVKMAASSAAIGRGPAADVVELPVSSSVAYA